ncbi:hypothetical protein LCGC14_2009210, partial [marine sediment metagenome]
MEAAEKTKAVAKIDNAIPANLIELALKQKAPIEQLEKLLALQERWDAQQAKKAYYSSLSKFQAECPPILKTKAGYADRYHYAPLDKIIDVIKDSMFENGLTYRWEQQDKNDKIIVTCIITHVAGHSEKTSLEGAADTSGSKNDIQARGSTVQYLRRYTLESVLGIATSSIDVDGQQPKEKPVKVTKEASNDILSKAKIIIDEYETAEDLQANSRPFIQEQVKVGLNNKDRKELAAYVSVKYEELTKGEEYAKTL